jgi:predicted unusual protein kinase regulating ubiquinone biosynthesis (AarF/ABC1/UbiB family)
VRVSEADDGKKRNEIASIRRGWGERLVSSGRIASTAARLAARRVIGAQEGQRDGALGDALAAELDKMKGMAMKIGQIMSYMDGALPEEAHRALRSLQRGATAMRYETMADVIREAFDADVDGLFDDFQREPIASASIGQVYRARYQGQDVAVKVQYPSIRETIAGDFSQLETFSRLASIATAVDGPALVAELRERFVEECDYEREAAHQDAFRRAFADDPVLRVPAAVLERTRTTVLTSEWCPGEDFYAFLETASSDRKSEVGLQLTRFAYRSLYGLATLNADPHPGNYLFPDDGSIVMLDFGCVRHFDQEMLDAERVLASAVLDDERAAFRDALMATGMVGDERRFDFDQYWEMLCWQYAPYRQKSFRFTTDYLKRAMEFNGPSNPNLRRLRIPPAWIWMARLQYGLHAVLTRLDAEAPFGDVLRQALDSPVEPLRMAAKA